MRAAVYAPSTPMPLSTHPSTHPSTHTSILPLHAPLHPHLPNHRPPLHTLQVSVIAYTVPKDRMRASLLEVSLSPRQVHVSDRATGQVLTAFRQPPIILVAPYSHLQSDLNSNRFSLINSLLEVSLSPQQVHVSDRATDQMIIAFKQPSTIFVAPLFIPPLRPHFVRTCSHKHT